MIMMMMFLILWHNMCEIFNLFLEYLGNSLKSCMNKRRGPCILDIYRKAQGPV